MAMIRKKHIKDYDILNSKIIVNPVSILGTPVNEINKLLRKVMKKDYKIVKESCLVNTVKSKRAKENIIAKLTIRTITKSSYNTIVRRVQGNNKYIVNIPYCKEKPNKQYLHMLEKFLVDAREYPDVIISIPIYGDCFGNLKKEVIRIIKESNYPAYIDIYVDDKTKDMF